MNAAPEVAEPSTTTPQEDAAHILVVDDDRRIRELIKRYLSEHGYRISTAENAAEGPRRA